MGKNGIDGFDIDVKFDKDGNLILPTPGNEDIETVSRTFNPARNDDDDYVDIEELARQESESMMNEKTEEIQSFGKPKLSKSGLPNNMPINKRYQPESEPKIDDSDFAPSDTTISTQPTIKRNNQIDPLKSLILNAKKIENKINLSITIQSIDKNLFDVLLDSYPDDFDKMLDVILEQNRENIQQSIKQSINEFYGKIE